MKPKHRRLLFLLGALVVMGGAVALILSSFEDNLVFFYTPTQLTEKQKTPDFRADRALRIGGLVKAGSVKNDTDNTLHFVITDLSHEVSVTYRGLVPSLFREGQGVVAQGTLAADGSIAAETILAKHDEKYMPREVMEELKKSGEWKPEMGSK